MGRNDHFGPILLLQFPNVKCMVVARCAKFSKIWLVHLVCVITTHLPTLQLYAIHSCFVFYKVTVIPQIHLFLLFPYIYYPVSILFRYRRAPLTVIWIVGCTALTATAVSGFLTLQAAGTATFCGTGAAVGETSIGVAAATAIGGTLACGKLFLLLANYAQWFNNVKSKCEKKLHPIRDKLDEWEREIKLVKEELDDQAQYLSI